MDNTLGSKVHQYLLAREAAESATKMAKELEDDLKEAMINGGVVRYEYMNKLVILIQAERRSFDAKTLKNLVSSAVFKTVTTVQVQAKVFDAAVAVGMISQEVSNQITTKTPYTQIRIGKKQNGTD